MSVLSAVAAVASGIAGALGGFSHHLHTLSVATRSWACLACGVPNELDRDTCWSCGAGYGQDPLTPTHIPIERRWLCPDCAVWNGIARTDCWRCGSVRNDAAGPWISSANRELPTGSHTPGAATASSPRAAPRTTAGAASRRRNA